MKKSLKALSIFALILTVLELVIFGSFLIVYFLNLFEFQMVVKDYTIAVILPLMVLCIINVLFTIISVVVFSKSRKQSDLKAADLLGDDVQEAYNFGMVGLIIVDENKTVLWTNELFRERKIDILDMNILEWLPQLKDLEDAGSDTIVRVLVNNSYYDVKFLADAGLYIFKDVTEFENLTQYSNREAVVVGLILIDSYSSISENADDANDIISKVRNAIFEYTKDFNVAIKRSKSDTYFLVCNYESLKKMEDDKFSLLDKIREIGEKEVITPTLSIGIAHGFPSITKLTDMASSALETCTARGGDQVVISKYGEDLKYFGGTESSTETRNKVKVRIVASTLTSLIKSSKYVLIMGHTATDMDAIGSCLGVKAICDHLGVASSVVYNPRVTESKTRAAMTSSFSRENLAKITLTPQEAIDKAKEKSNTLLVICDTHSQEMVIEPRLVDMIDKIAIIDHHRKSEKFIENNIFAHIDTGASSATEIVTEFIYYSFNNPRIKLPSAFATIMLSGIILDSNHFKSKSTSSNTFEASMVLEEYGADSAKADDFLKDEYEEYALVTKIAANMYAPFYGVVVCRADDNDVVEGTILSKVANQCMSMKGINAAFVIGKVDEKTIKISCRSDGTINVQILAEKMGGGGHQHMAATTFENSTIEHANERLMEVLKEYLQDARVGISEDR